MTFEALEKRNRRRTISRYGRLVRQLLKEDVGCRNDDRYLILRVCQEILEQCGSDAVVVTVDTIRKLPSFETIIRVRAKIQNEEHQYLPTDEKVRRQRGISETVWREWAQANF
jgi:hypothetical protein